MAAAKTVARFVRISPRKVREVIRLLKGEDAQTALEITSCVKKAAAVHVWRAVKSALANAEKQKRLKAENLYISKIAADEGPMLKRYKAAPMGRAVMIRKRTCHISVELDVKKPRLSPPGTKPTIKKTVSIKKPRL